MAEATAVYEKSQNTTNREELVRRIKVSPGMDYYLGIKNKLLQLNVSGVSLENAKLLRQIADEIIPDIRRAASFHTEPFDPVERQGLAEVKGLESLIKNARRTMVEVVKKNIESIETYGKKELNISDIDYLQNFPFEIRESIRILCCDDVISAAKVSNLDAVISSIIKNYHEKQKQGRELINSNLGSLAASHYSITLNDSTINDNPFVMSPHLLSYVQERTKNAATDEDKAKAVFDMIVDYVKYGGDKRGDKTYRNADETFKTKEGVCGEMGYLYVAAARASGLKSNIAEVDIDERGEKVCHACASVELNGRTILVDPAYQTIDAKHKKFKIVTDEEAREKYKLYNGLEDKVDVAVKDASISEEEKNDAVKKLKEPDYLFKVKQALDLMIVKEDEAKLIAYLSCFSSRFPDYVLPVHAFIQAQSSTGKTHLIDTVVKLFPDQNIIAINRVSDAAWDYFKESLDGKVMTIEEFHTLTDKAMRILLPKLWKSEKQSKITVMDNGERVTKSIGPKGLPACLAASCKDFPFEVMNRGILVSLDYSREQTRLINEHKAKIRAFPQMTEEKFSNLSKEYADCYVAIKPYNNFSPFLPILNNFLIGGVTDRRNFEKLDLLSNVVAHINQFQRPIISIDEKETIPVLISDIYIPLSLQRKFLIENSCLDKKAIELYKVIQGNNGISSVQLTEKIRSCGPESSFVSASRKSERELQYEIGSYLAQLKDFNFISQSDSTYSVNQSLASRFDLNDMTINLKPIEDALHSLNQQSQDATAKMGLSYNKDKNGFEWQNYKENLVDPLTGDKLLIKVEALDGNGKIKVERCNE
ncbi:transglutaminase domain-containing protein [Candidatus Woesearchaeota archaeon]|nr:transglutaminase domain-containing protein [Candidatus Woesearchaeota archaeon]